MTRDIAAETLARYRRVLTPDGWRMGREDWLDTTPDRLAFPPCEIDSEEDNGLPVAQSEM